MSTGGKLHALIIIIIIIIHSSIKQPQQQQLFLPTGTQKFVCETSQLLLYGM